MRYLALVCDYDGTIALGGRVTEETVAALEEVLASGRKLILVTGRELDDLLSVFPYTHLFEWVVAENGALAYRPSTKQEKSLAEPAPPALVEALHAKEVRPLSVGRVIVSTLHPNEAVVLEVIRELGLESQIIFNKGAVMVLPTGVNKASGLQFALGEMGLSAHNAVGIGDAENDHAFLALCEISAAVANALPMIKERADFIAQGIDGLGVQELAQELLGDDLQEIETRLTRHDILLGTRDNGEEVRIKPYRINLLLAGSSGGGKTTLATGLMERLAEQGYQFCIVDPEGDYTGLEEAIAVGNEQQPPSVNEVVQLLENPDVNAAINLLGVPLADRPLFLAALLPALMELRTRTGRPHWIVLDEAHHLLPSSWESASLTLPQELEGLMLITVHPNEVVPAVLSAVDTVLVVGDSPRETIEAFAKALDERVPSAIPETLETAEALVWSRTDDAAVKLNVSYGRAERRRHQRKYAEGDLGADKSFYFRGPEGKLNLRAQNLTLFLQIAEGLDDETWMYHLWQGDYSRWFREAIKDEVLAAEAARIEGAKDITAEESRARMKALIEEHYTLPASSSPATSDQDRKSL